MTDCYALKAKRCTVLNVRECQGSECPFYKTLTEFVTGRHESMDRLRSEGKQELIERYHARG